MLVVWYNAVDMDLPVLKDRVFGLLPLKHR